MIALLLVLTVTALDVHCPAGLMTHQDRPVCGVPTESGYAVSECPDGMVCELATLGAVLGEVAYCVSKVGERLDGDRCDSDADCFGNSSCWYGVCNIHNDNMTCSQDNKNHRYDVKLCPRGHMCNQPNCVP